MKTEQLLAKWQERYARAKSAYQTELDEMIDSERAYLGTRRIRRPDGGTAADQAANVRKSVYELIEAQVDSTIPLPKVTAQREEDIESAQAIEQMLLNQIDRLPLERLNDEQERICPVDGAAFFHVEWDSEAGGHGSPGDVSVRLLHPRQVIPQPGAQSIEDCDYLFILTEQTRDSILRRYCVDIGEEAAAEGGLELGEAQRGRPTDSVTMVTVYYKNDEGGVSTFSFAGDRVIERIDDYQRRKKRACKKCGANAPPPDEACPSCGGKQFESVNKQFDILPYDLTLQNGGKLPAGTPIPYYSPNRFPLCIRKNISQYGKFIGGSDAQAVKDQQNDINIFMTKLRKKLLKGGSYILKDPEMKLDVSDEELKITNATPQQAATFSVRSVQGNVQHDLAIIERNYEWMRQTLGITDSYQGRRDPTAASGLAKQVMVAQSSGRLESKRRMKDAAFADLYRMIFSFILAYADEPRAYRTTGKNGETVFETFDKYALLRNDAMGEIYYEDSFLFSVDTASSLSRNREVMWQENRLNFQNGCYGSPGELHTLLLFWRMMEVNHYPGAKFTLDALQRAKDAADQGRQARSGQAAGARAAAGVPASAPEADRPGGAEGLPPGALEGGEPNAGGMS